MNDVPSHSMRDAMPKCACGHAEVLESSCCDMCSLDSHQSLGCTRCGISVCVKCAEGQLLCPGRHPLRWIPAAYGWSCQFCSERFYKDKSTGCAPSGRFKCKACSYNLCPHCAAREVLHEVSPMRAGRPRKLAKVQALDAVLFGESAWKSGHYQVSGI